MNELEMQDILLKIYGKIKEGKMYIKNISCEPHLQPRYITDTSEETQEKDNLEYNEYNITIIHDFHKEVKKIEEI